MTATACPARSAFRCPACRVRVTDPETGKELRARRDRHDRGQGPNVFKGYWRMPEKTKAEFRDDGFFITGDLGKIDPDGYVHIRRPRQGPGDLRRLQRLSRRKSKARSTPCRA